jgi:hypothetical protein
MQDMTPIKDRIKRGREAVQKARALIAQVEPLLSAADVCVNLTRDEKLASIILDEAATFSTLLETAKWNLEQIGSGRCKT